MKNREDKRESAITPPPFTRILLEKKTNEKKQSYIKVATQGSYTVGYLVVTKPLPVCYPFTSYRNKLYTFYNTLLTQYKLSLTVQQVIKVLS